MLNLIREEGAALQRNLLYDYSQIDDAHRSVVMEAAVDIKRRTKRAQEDLIEVGQRLCEVKDVLAHGQFQAWVETEFSLSQRMAQNLMNVAKRFAGKSETVSLFSDSALYLLAAPSVPDEAVEQAATEARETGKSPTKERVKEIVEEVKPKRPLTLDETIAMLWRVIQSDLAARLDAAGHLHATDQEQLDRLLVRGDDPAKYWPYHGQNERLEPETFDLAYYTVKAEIGARIILAQRSQPDLTGQRQAAAERAQEEPHYISVWTLERAVQDAIRVFWRADEQPDIAGNLRALMAIRDWETQALGKAIIGQLDGLIYRKRDLIQAINNVRDQAEQRTAEKAAQHEPAREKAKLDKIEYWLLGTGWSVAHGKDGEFSMGRWLNGERISIKETTRAETILAAERREKELIAAEKAAQLRPSIMADRILATKAEAGLIDEDAEQDTDDYIIVEAAILALARQFGLRRFSITVDVQGDSVQWGVHAWAPGYEMGGAASLAEAIAEEQEAGNE